MLKKVQHDDCVSERLFHSELVAVQSNITEGLNNGMDWKVLYVCQLLEIPLWE